MSDISGFFDKCPMLQSPDIKLTINVNQGYLKMEPNLAYGFEYKINTNNFPNGVCPFMINNFREKHDTTNVVTMSCYVYKSLNDEHKDIPGCQ